MRNAVPSQSVYLARWACLHGGYDPATGLATVRWWLRVVYLLSRPVARVGIGPDAITLAGTLVTAVLLVPAAAGGRWPLAGVMIVVVGGVLDNVDGCVAVLTGRATAWGYVLDSVADRVADGFCLVALWLLGAPGGLCVGAGAAVMFLEYLRARAGNAGYGDIGIVTVGERPTRIIVIAFGFLGAGVAPGLAALSATIAAAATAAAGTVGTVQLGVTIHRALAGRTSPAGQPVLDESGDDLRGQGDQR